MGSAPEREAREERVVKREQGEGEGEGEGRERMQRSKLEIRRWRQSRGELSTSVDDCAQCGGVTLGLVAQLGETQRRAASGRAAEQAIQG